MGTGEVGRCAAKAGKQEETTSWLPGLLLPDRSFLCAGPGGTQGGIKPGSGLMALMVQGGMRALSGAGAVQCDAGYPSPRPGPVLGSRGVGAPSPFSPARDPGSPLPPERGSQSATRQDEEENGCQVGSRHWPLRQRSGKGSPAPVYAGP